MNTDLQIKVIGTLVAMALLLQPSALAGQLPGPSSGQQAQLPDSPSALQSRAHDGALQPSGGQAAVQQPQQPQPARPHEPVGTAAAGWLPATGIAASRPAGAALAPAKQRRARGILIKVGAVVAAGAAVGTVAALSAGSPSKPPGAR
jgi:hypothetical protein